MVDVGDGVASGQQMAGELPVALGVGGGTMRLRRRKPTAFSTLPFSIRWRGCRT